MSTSRRGSRLVFVFVIGMALVSSFSLPFATAQDSVGEAREEREEVRAERANALRELEAAKLQDDELATLLNYLGTEIATTELAVEILQDELVVVASELEAARQVQQDAIEETRRLQEEIAMVAVAGFVRSTRKEEAFFGSGSLERCVPAGFSDPRGQRRTSRAPRPDASRGGGGTPGRTNGDRSGRGDHRA